MKKLNLVLLILTLIMLSICVTGCGEKSNENTPNGDSQLNSTFTQGLEFSLRTSSKGDYYILTGVGTSTDDEIKIPNEYNGKPVTIIEDSALKGSKYITSITIPDSVKTIGVSAFENCSQLTSVTIGNGVTSIDYDAFRYCRSLKSVTMGNSVTSIGISAFYDCRSLKSVTIPDSVTSIGYQAFYDCNSLTSVKFENTSGWFIATSSTDTSGANISSSELSNTATAAEYLTSYEYIGYYWKRK